MDFFGWREGEREEGCVCVCVYAQKIESCNLIMAFSRFRPEFKSGNRANQREIPQKNEASAYYTSALT